MKVKCIDNNSLEGYLTKNKIYLVNKVSDDCYEITDDKDEKTYYLKYRFVPVDENIMKVKCINNELSERLLTINKIYSAENENESYYRLIGDDNKPSSYLKSRFKPLEESTIIRMAREIGEMVEKKDNDYNSAFSKTLQEYGNVAYFLRIDDKLNRLKNLLLNNNNAEINESVEDTLKDIVGYTLLMLKEIKNRRYINEGN